MWCLCTKAMQDHYIKAVKNVVHYTFNTYNNNYTLIYKTAIPAINFLTPPSFTSQLTKCGYRTNHTPKTLSNSGLKDDKDRENAVFKTDTVLQQKLNIIKRLGFQSDEHAQKFYRLSQRTLWSILKCYQLDQKLDFQQNRLYYLSDKLKCDPAFLSTYLSKRPFLYQISLDWFKKSIDVLLEMGVPPKRIVTDLWVIKYHPDTIRKRLQRVKDSGRDDLTPWMVRCTEDILLRSMEITKTTKDILGSNRSVHDYLAERLRTTPKVVEVMCYRIPSINTMKLTKAKSILDYLFSEGFTEEDIIKVPRILAHSLDTTKARIKKLRSVGVDVTNFYLVCKSNKDFNKFFENTLEKKPKMKSAVKEELL